MTTTDIQYYHSRGTSVDKLIENGATLAEIFTAGITLSEVLESTQTMTAIKTAKGCTTKDLLDASKKDRFGATRLNNSFYITIIRRIYVDGADTLSNLVTLGVTVRELKQSGATLTMMVEAGFGITSLREAGYTIAEMLAYYPAESTNKIAVMRSLFENGVTVKQLYGAGCTVAELVTAGTTLKQLIQAEIPATSLLSYGYTIKELLNNGITIKNLKSAGYTSEQILEVSTAGITNQLQLTTMRQDIAAKLISEGGTISELVNINVTLGEMIGAGISLKLLLEAGYTVEDLQACGVSTIDILKANATEATLKNILDSGVYTIKDYFDAFISEENLSLLKTTYNLYDAIYDWMDTNIKEETIDLNTVVKELIRIEYIMNTSLPELYGENEPDKVLIKLIGEVKNSEEDVHETEKTLATANTLVNTNKITLQKKCRHGFIDDFIQYSTNPNEYRLVENLNKFECVICGAKIPSVAETITSLIQAENLFNSGIIERLKLCGAFTNAEIDKFYEFVQSITSFRKKVEKLYSGRI